MPTDLKLAFRMLIRHPLLTIVGGTAMAFGLTVGVAGFEVRTQLVSPRLPLDEGHRVVGIRLRDLEGSEVPTQEADYRALLGRLRTIQGLGAAALVERNLEVSGQVEPIRVAEMTASAFALTRIAPMAGRTLVEADESPGAPPVAIIGHSLWQRRFLGDPQIVGRSVRLGAAQTTIVGVMPEDFGFPVAHQVWTPLRRQTGAQAEPALLVFGRLSPGVSLGQAQAEAETIGRWRAADEAALAAEVVEYPRLIRDSRDVSIGATLANAFLIVLLVVVAANVALLMFARVAARENEISVRNALGASRSRIVGQLFVEASVLSALAGVVGMVGARYALGSLWRMWEADAGRPLPFWIGDGLTPSTMVYGLALTLLIAAIVGIVPALKVTGHGLQARLQQFTRGGSYRFGGAWTVAIASQVAVTVLFPAVAFLFHRWVVEGQARDVGLPAEQFLSARLESDRAVDIAAIFDELRRQLSGEPGVAAVTFGDRLPGMSHTLMRFEVEGDPAAPRSGHRVRVAAVEPGFFESLGVRVLGGRAFTPSEAASGANVVMVNASFAERVLPGRSVLGQRVRQPGDGDRPAGPWMEIVGVAPDLGMGAPPEDIGLYRPLSSNLAAVHVAIRVAGEPVTLSRRLQTLAGQVDPTLRVYDVLPLDEVGADQFSESYYVARLAAVLSGMALLLSLTGVYAVVAYTVVQRTREIGTRVALGADRRRIVGAIIRRPLWQISIGILAGTALVVLAFLGLRGSTPTPVEVAGIVAYAVAMLAVCLSACVGPVRRALRLQPSDVLRADV